MITDRLFELQDTGYRDFQSRLMPDVPKEKVIRTPALRKLAKELAGTEEAAAFILQLPHKYYEEDNLHTFLICEMKDYDDCMAEVERFLPYIDNWATCDCFTPKVFKKHRAEVYEKIKQWLGSAETYTVRFGIVTLMDYLKTDFEKQMLSLVADIRSEEYYINMATARSPFLLEKRTVTDLIGVGSVLQIVHFTSSLSDVYELTIKQRNICGH